MLHDLIFISKFLCLKKYRSLKALYLNWHLMAFLIKTFRIQIPLPTINLSKWKMKKSVYVFRCKNFKREFKGREGIILPINLQWPLLPPNSKKQKHPNELCTKYNIRNYVLIFVVLSEELCINTKLEVIS